MRRMALDRLFSLFSSSKGTSKKSSGGGGVLQPLPDPKVKPRQTSFPGHMTQLTPSGSALPKNDLNLANVDIVSTYRFGADTSSTLRVLSRGNPDLAGAVSGHLRMGIPSGFIPPAYNPDGSFNVEATRFCMEFLGRMNAMPGWDTGFTTVGSIRSVSEALAYEALIEGGMAMELVLNKARQPWYFAPVSVSPSRFRLYDDFGGGTKTLKPVQVVGGQEIDLDIPNFFMVWVDPDLLNPYPHSPLESSIQPVLAGTTFLQDLRRVCARHVYPRYDLSIDQDKLKEHMTEEQLLDPEKKKAFLNEVFVAVQNTVNNLGVEEAVVHFDFLVVSYVKGQDGDVPNTFETVKDILDGKIATGAKSNGTILGHGDGTQNIASTETMIALLTANGLIREKLTEMYSKALTLACRLMAFDVVVRFEFDEIELRPKSELEAFYAQRQSRILEQLSFGFISDEEASLRLTGRLPTGNIDTPLSGTMFLITAGLGQGGDQIGGNGYSGTGAGGGQSGGSASQQARKPTTPANKRGQRKTA
jgi:hypothetical protein